VTCVLFGEGFAEEYVAEVCVAFCAYYLGAETVGVGESFDCIFYLVVEARPAAVGLEFRR